MLEGLVSAILNRTLGQYIENVSPDQFQRMAWSSGDFLLKNVKLKKEALDKFALPIDVVDGFIQELELKFPFTHIQTQPVVIKIKNLSLLAIPNAKSTYNQAEEEERQQQAKQEKLINSEYLSMKTTGVLSDATQQVGFISQLVTKVVDNVQITVENVHIRYEDSLSDPDQTFSAGITLAGFTVDSCDENWQKAFIEGSHETIYKLASLKSLAIYWNTKSRSLYGLKDEEHIDEYGKFIARDDYIPNENQYILKPVSGEGKLTMRRSPSKGVPRLHTTLIFDELGFVLDDDQYRTALLMLGQFHIFIRQQQYRKYRPLENPSEAPRKWLQFAGNCVLRQIHDKHIKWTWEYIKSRRDNRKEYVQLYKRAQTNTSMPEDVQRLRDLEWDLSYQDIRFYRSIARSELLKEKVQNPQPTKPQQGGWVSWLWSGSKQQSENDTEFDGVTEEQRRELFAAIEWDEKQAMTDSIDLPADFIKMEVEAQLERGSFALKRDPHGFSGGKEIISMIFHNFAAKFMQRPRNFVAEMSLGALSVHDGSISNTIYPQIVRVKDVNNYGVEVKDPFFYVMFEHQPLDERADNALTVRMRNMEIVYNAAAMEAIIDFVRPPETQLESIDALIAVASDTLLEFRDQTKYGLEFALDQHKTIDLVVDMKAPIIILPENMISKTANAVVLDSGHINITSNLVKKEMISQIQRKQKEHYDEEDLKQLESAMYDKFNVILTSTQLLVGGTADQCLEEITNSSENKDLHVVDSITMEFQVSISILPHAPDLTKTRVTGHLPLLQARMSDKKYKTIMKILDVAIPKSEIKEIETQGAISRKRGKSNFGLTQDDDDDWLNEHIEGQENKLDDREDNKESKLIAKSMPNLTDPAGQVTFSESDQIKKVNFELIFQVDKLQADLLKSDRDASGSEHILAKVVAENFALNVRLRALDLTADVKLKTFYVEDLMVEEDSKFKRIISSDADSFTEKVEGDDNSSHSPEADGNLVHVTYFKVQKQSPEYQSVYKGIDQNVGVAVSTINLVVTRQSILVLFDFILSTFTSGDINEVVGPQIQEQDVEEHQALIRKEDPHAEKMEVRVKLSSIVLILNNDGTKLATVKLSKGDLEVSLREKAMCLHAHLGNIAILDDSIKDTEPYREILTIQGHELADFRYETFDMDDEMYPGYDTSIYLRTGSLQFTFLEKPISKIIDFGAKFARMKALFDSARQAAMNQASQIQKRLTRLHYDVVISTPIVIFPKDSKSNNLIVANLGEISAINSFAQSPNDDFEYKIDAGLRDVRLYSYFVLENGYQQDLQMIKNINFIVDVTARQHEADHPEMQVTCSMSDVEMNLTERQYGFVAELSQSISRAFTMTQVDKEEWQTDGAPIGPSRKVPVTTSDFSKTIDQSPAPVLHMVPELDGVADGNGRDVNLWSKLDLTFKVNTIYLEIFRTDGSQTKQLTDTSLARFSLNETSIQYCLLTNGSMEAELQIKSFTIHDTRADVKTSFPEVVPAATHGRPQFMVKFSMSGRDPVSTIVILTVDSPKILFALEPVFALRDFLTSPDIFKNQKEHQSTKSDVSIRDDDSRLNNSQVSKRVFHYRLHIVKPEIILLANPEMENSEAIVLSINEILLVQQNNLTFKVDEVGLFLRRMDNSTDNLRFMDNVEVTMFMENLIKDNLQLTNIEFQVQPLVFRVSNRDIGLIMSIVNKASELSQKSEEVRQAVDDEVNMSGRPRLRVRSASGRLLDQEATVAISTDLTNTASELIRCEPCERCEPQRKISKPASIISKESLQAHISGIQLVLIEDEHELPMIDMSVKSFQVDVADFSSNMRVDTTLSTYVNFFNLTNSHWEPLIEPWTVKVEAQRYIDPSCTKVRLISSQRLNVNITSTLIDTTMTTMRLLNKESDLDLTKARGSTPPYMIINKTGFDIDIWSVSEKTTNSQSLNDGGSIPWRFDDWRKVRESFSFSHNSVRLRFKGVENLSIEKDIQLDNDGDSKYPIRGLLNGVRHWLVVSVNLIDNIKHVTLRSPFVLHNNTQIELEMIIIDLNGRMSSVMQIHPGAECPVPIQSCYTGRIKVRPPPIDGYDWSREILHWADFHKDNAPRSIVCRNFTAEVDPFRLQIFGEYDKEDDRAKKFPFMRLKLSPPVQVENLLPYDISYRVYDKNMKSAQWKGVLRQGGISSLHAVELSHFLLLNVTVKNTSLRPSEFAVINAYESYEVEREDRLKLRDQDGYELSLYLHYHEEANSGGAFRVSVYAPYVVVNQTSLNIALKTKVFMRGSRNAAGQTFNTVDSRLNAQPLLFSYDGRQRNSNRYRAVIRVENSEWSKPVSFEAVGSEQEVIMPKSDDSAEIHIGVTVSEGHSKYRFTKLVTLTPRFVIRNKLDVDIAVKEPGGANTMIVKVGNSEPIKFLRSGQAKQLILGCVSRSRNQYWSHPFDIQEIGHTYVRMKRSDTDSESLLRIDIQVFKATIFLNISAEKNNRWPYKIENMSSVPIRFCQMLSEDKGFLQLSPRIPYYELNPEEVIPYAWDYPAAQVKGLKLEVNGKCREINMSEIGVLVPFKYPRKENSLNQRQNFGVMAIEIVAEGFIQVLKLSDYKKDRSVFKLKSPTMSPQLASPTDMNRSDSLSRDFELPTIKDEDSLILSVDFEGVGVSLINMRLKELAYLTVKGLKFSYNESSMYRELDLIFRWIQIDNQLFGGVYPIVLYPTAIPRNGKETEETPTFHAKMIQVKDDTHGVLYMKYASVLLQQISLEFDEDFLLSVFEFLKVVNTDEDKDANMPLIPAEEKFNEVDLTEGDRDIYFEVLHIQPLKISISFVRTKAVNVEDRTTSRNPLTFFLNILTMAIGNINDAPVKLNSLVVRNVRASRAVLTDRIAKHYGQQFFYQVHKLVGSADFLGNPVGLFNNLSSGVIDFFYEPYQGLMMNDRPQDLGIGIARGTASFLKKSVYGVSDSFAKVTGSIGKGLSAATMDEAYQSRRKIRLVRNRPKHALYGVKAGATQFASSLSSGVEGLVRRPIEGAEREGATGLFKGVGKGLVGLVTKPIVGVFDLASNVTEGIRNTTTVFDDNEISPVRLPRYIGPDKVLRRYDAREALGQSWLKDVAGGKYFNEEYVTHVDLPGDEYVVILTMNFILCIAKGKLKLKYEISFREISMIRLENTGISLSLRGGVQGPFIPISDGRSRQSFFDNVQQVVKEFNDRRQLSE